MTPLLALVFAAPAALAADPPPPDRAPDAPADDAPPDPGVYGYATGRVDLFMADKDTPGPRFGASVWGRSAVWPLQTHTGGEDGAVPTPFHLLQYGLSAVLRFDPSTPVTGTFGFGFGRADLDGYEGGVQAVPMFTVEAGIRQRVGPAFVDYAAQSGWGSARDTAGAWEEWWTVSAGVSIGFHAK